MTLLATIGTLRAEWHRGFRTEAFAAHRRVAPSRDHSAIALQHRRRATTRNEPPVDATWFGHTRYGGWPPGEVRGSLMKALSTPSNEVVGHDSIGTVG